MGLDGLTDKSRHLVRKTSTKASMGKALRFKSGLGLLEKEGLPMILSVALPFGEAGYQPHW